MHWLQTLDADLFRFINLTLQNPFFNWLMPIISGNALFFPLLVAAGVWCFWKGGVRARVLVLMLLVILPLGDSFIISTLKELIGRPRPPLTLPDVHALLGVGASKSMPSAHAANWGAAAMIAFLYYRRTLWFTLPLAVLVSFSRVYNGVHYPSDVLVGALLGAGYGFGGVWVLGRIWRGLGQRFFAETWKNFPSLRSPSDKPSATLHPPSSFEPNWLPLGYLFIAVMLLVRLGYVATDVIDLSEDESYYWLWSQHPALSYYSKPLLIAVTYGIGTAIFGDNTFGVRCFSPVIAAALGFLLLRFVAREASARAGFFLLLAINCTPIFAVGGTLMTIDPLSVLFWTAAMLAGWRAVQPNSTTRDWLWVGLWMGLGFLSKYTALFQLLCWVVFFALWKPARVQLRRPGVYLALLVNALCMLPVLIWNAQRDWITFRHVAGDARLGEPWHFRINFLTDFLFQELMLLNPAFFILTVTAAIAFWRQRTAAGAPSTASASPPPHQRAEPLLGTPGNDAERSRHLRVFLFSMGAPLFLVYLGWTFHSRVLPNWIVPSVLPMFCLAAIYWNEKWATHRRALTHWLRFGFGFGLVAVVLLHDTDLIHQVTGGRSLPPQADPLGRVRAWRETAEVVRGAREKLAAEGKPVFVIGGHYGVTSQLAFRLGDGTTNVFCLVGDRPKNQFYFWPRYTNRLGDNAVYVTIVGAPRRSGGELLNDFLSGKPDATPPAPTLPPEQLLREFASVTNAGVFPAQYRGRVMRWVQVFECRNLR